MEALQGIIYMELLEELVFRTGFHLQCQGQFSLQEEDSGKYIISFSFLFLHQILKKADIG